MKLKYLLIVQARINSKRLPGKVLMKLGKYTVIEFLLKRLIKSKKIDKVIVATTNNKTDDILCDHLDRLKIQYFRGSEDNVLKRFYDASTIYKAHNIIRITADCPFIDIKMMNKMINIFEKDKVDYLSNSYPPTFPDGLDIEIFNYKSLKNAFKNAKSKYDKEHVTSYIKINKKLKILNYENKVNLSKYRWTLDEALDYKLIKKIYEKLKNNIYFTWKDILKLEDKNPQFFSINMKIKRNQGSELSSSQKLWKRALKVIPNGNMFLSKNPNQFLPDIWPAYFTKSKDSFVWDLDNKKYFDFCTMGVGTNILGYSNKFVDKAVKESISKGNMSSLNCPEEVLLSEKLISIHNDFDQVR